MNIKTQKEVAEEMFEILHKSFEIEPKGHFMDIAIAGGCARDWYFNELAQDVDIWIYCDDDSNEEDIHLKIDNLPFTLKGFFSVYSGEDLAFNPNILCVAKVEYKGVDADIIFVKTDIKSVVDGFVCSLSKAIYNTQNGFIYPYSDFVKSIESGNILFAEWCPQKYIRKMLMKKHLKSFKFFKEV